MFFVVVLIFTNKLIPVNIISSEEGEDCGDDPDDAAHSIEAAVYFVEGEITGQRPSFTHTSQPFPVTSDDLIIQDWLVTSITERQPKVSSVPLTTLISHT